MDSTKKEQLKTILDSVFSQAEGNKIPLANLGSRIKVMFKGFSYRDYGHEKLLQILEEIPDIIVIERDDSYAMPVYFAGLIGAASSAPQETPEDVLSRPAVLCSKDLPRNFGNEVRSSQSTWQDLAGKALKENWGDEKKLPLLRNYITYTYLRLLNEGKVKLAVTRPVIAFDTGLVDERYEPIYAILEENTAKDDPLVWRLSGFCCRGEDLGKRLLTALFNPIPKAANYLDQFSDVVYDSSSGDLDCDWDHIILENADRIPSELLERRAKGFEVRNCDTMGKGEIEKYKKSFAEYLENNPTAHRELMSDFKTAVELTKKKVAWNYKTAVPIYFASDNTVSLLLPLSLLSENKVDLALVVEKQPSGNYQGHTIYTLDMAYKNARLIARPESAWLKDL